ncbi:MAG: ABC transporter permease subunit [Gammaproteobacteria bacterium]|nr:ABC transporter permease subunit [Gammaproteobacteria bacterium]
MMIPTIVGALFLNFLLLKLLPGSPQDYMVGKLYGSPFQEGYSNTTHDLFASPVIVPVDPLKDTVWQQFTTMACHYMFFDFGKSYFQDKTVIALIKEGLPVSLFLGFFGLVISYLIAGFLGIFKAMHEGSFFVWWSTVFLTFFYAIPNFLLGMLLLIIFAGGTYVQCFPLQGLISDHWDQFSWFQKFLDLLHHLALPLLTIVLGGIGSFTFFVKSAFQAELKKPYIQAVYARGGTVYQALYGHALKHVMILVMSHFPQSFTRIFFMNTLVVEMIFSLNGLGFLIFQAILKRDYSVVFGTLFIFILIGLVVQLLVDIVMTFLDPRLHFKGGRHYG